tara:strand:+ start:775 stop:1011 length:237 start_codon:yes stop_codon:yes gene_type:complete
MRVDNELKVGDLVTSERYADRHRRLHFRESIVGMAGIVVKIGWGYLVTDEPCYRIKWNVGYKRIFWHQRKDLELLSGT